MLDSTSPTPGARARRLAATYYLYVFLDEFVLLYPVYALLFTDTGLAVPQISSLFLVWSLTALLLEVPSGVLADAVSRRVLLGVAPLLGAVGFGLWVVVPSYGVFVVGFALPEPHRPPPRAGQPTPAEPDDEATSAEPDDASVPTTPNRAAATWRTVLRTGLAEARVDRSVRRALLLLPVMLGMWGGLEEYTSLLAGEIVVAERVPLLVLLASAGVMVGGLLAPYGQRLPDRWFAGTVAGAAVLLALGALSRRPAGFLLIAVAFGVLQMASVVLDVRLQQSITGPSRATVTSLAGLGTDLVTIALYAGYALASAAAGHAVIFAWCALPYLVVAGALARHRGRRPPAAPGSARRVGPDRRDGTTRETGGAAGRRRSPLRTSGSAGAPDYVSCPGHARAALGLWPEPRAAGPGAGP